jgi:hypothetical protein
MSRAVSTGSETILGGGYKLRLVIFEDMKDGTLTTGVLSPASEFNEFAPEAQKVLDSMKWRGS